MIDCFYFSLQFVIYNLNICWFVWYFQQRNKMTCRFQVEILKKSNPLTQTVPNWVRFRRISAAPRSECGRDQPQHAPPVRRSFRCPYSVRHWWWMSSCRMVLLPWRTPRQRLPRHCFLLRRLAVVTISSSVQLAPKLI